jgi:hypothetical protein
METGSKLEAASPKEGRTHEEARGALDGVAHRRFGRIVAVKSCAFGAPRFARLRDLTAPPGRASGIGAVDGEICPSAAAPGRRTDCPRMAAARMNRSSPP